jgi:glyoxylase-like metal-dependent hydrolase (beta-lactamase superfamily II)
VTRLEVPERDIVGLRAANPGPFSLSGTNSWIIGRDPAWLIDPGPWLPEHLAALLAEGERRGGFGGIALTHDHLDHSEAVPALKEHLPSVPVAAARGEVDIVLEEGQRFGPLETLSTPGHAPDHLAFVVGPIAFSGDAVLGEGSVFIMPAPATGDPAAPAALSAYLDALARLRERRLTHILPGHGPIVTDPERKLTEYIEHRLERERRLLAALAAGRRSVAELLDDAWSDAPEILRPAAAVTLAAHLEKLDAEGRLPEGVERPERPDWLV